MRKLKYALLGLGLVGIGFYCLRRGVSSATDDIMQQAWGDVAQRLPLL
jgi:hypothetical protein